MAEAWFQSHIKNPNLDYTYLKRIPNTCQLPPSRKNCFCKLRGSVVPQLEAKGSGQRWLILGEDAADDGIMINIAIQD